MYEVAVIVWCVCVCGCVAVCVRARVRVSVWMLRCDVREEARARICPTAHAGRQGSTLG